jgi:hypothetical protein
MSCITNLFEERNISESVGLTATVFEEDVSELEFGKGKR